MEGSQKVMVELKKMIMHTILGERVGSAAGGGTSLASLLCNELAARVSSHSHSLVAESLFSLLPNNSRGALP